MGQACAECLVYGVPMLEPETVAVKASFFPFSMLFPTLPASVYPWNKDHTELRPDNLADPSKLL